MHDDIVRQDCWRTSSCGGSLSKRDSALWLNTGSTCACSRPGWPFPFTKDLCHILAQLAMVSIGRYLAGAAAPTGTGGRLVRRAFVGCRRVCHCRCLGSRGSPCRGLRSPCRAWHTIIVRYPFRIRSVFPPRTVGCRDAARIGCREARTKV